MSLTLLLSLFVSFSAILYASKVLFKFHTSGRFQDKLKNVFTRKILFIFGVILISVFSYLYLRSFIIWNNQIPYFDVRVNTNNFSIIPWQFVPLRFGVTGLVGFACLFSYFFRKFEKEILIFGLIAIVAFLAEPYYSDFRMEKYIMASFAGLASILLFRLLTIQRHLITKQLMMGIIIGVIITSSSLSILMYLGY